MIDTYSVTMPLLTQISAVDRAANLLRNVIIEIVLVDHGPGIADIEKAMQAGYSTAPDNIRSLGFGAGMGLPNMKKNSDSMEISSVVGEGTRIVMRINT